MCVCEVVPFPIILMLHQQSEACLRLHSSLSIPSLPCCSLFIPSLACLGLFSIPSLSTVSLFILTRGFNYSFVAIVSMIV